MKKVLLILMCCVMIGSMAACSSKKKASDTAAGSSSDEVVTLTGTGKGFGGLITVTVKKQGDKIISVEAVGDKETEGIGSKAIEELPAKIEEANSTGVDVVSSATISSEGLIYAVNNALDPDTYPAPQE